MQNTMHIGYDLKTVHSSEINQSPLMDCSKNTLHLSHIQLHARPPSTPAYLMPLKNVAYPYRVRFELSSKI